MPIIVYYYVCQKRLFRSRSAVFFCARESEFDVLKIPRDSVGLGWVLKNDFFLFSNGVGPSVATILWKRHNMIIVLFLFLQRRLTLYISRVISLFAVYLWKIEGKKVFLTEIIHTYNQTTISRYRYYFLKMFAIIA